MAETTRKTVTHNANFRECCLWRGRQENRHREGSEEGRIFNFFFFHFKTRKTLRNINASIKKFRLWYFRLEKTDINVNIKEFYVIEDLKDTARQMPTSGNSIYSIDNTNIIIYKLDPAELRYT